MQLGGQPCILTEIKFTLACQSAESGINRHKAVDASSELTRTFTPCLAPLRLGGHLQRQVAVHLRYCLGRRSEGGP